MNDDLFANLPPTKSPRLLWMEKHGITVESTVSSVGKKWLATSDPGNFAKSFVSHESEMDAIVGLALKLSLKLWNE